MADRMAGSVEIYGNVTEEDLKAIAEVSRKNGYTIDWCGEATFDGVLAAAREGSLELCDPDAPYGMLEPLTDLLRERGIKFVANSDAKYEYDSVAIYYDGRRVREFHSNQSHDTWFLPDYVVEKAIGHLRQGEAGKALRLLSTSRPPKMPKGVRIVRRRSRAA